MKNDPIRIGINPISWSNDDLPSLGGEIPLSTALAEGKAIGYEGFELGNKFPKEPAALRELMAGYGLDVVSGLVFGTVGRTLRERGVRRRREAPAPARRKWLQGHGLRRGRARDPGRAAAALQAATFPHRRRLEALWRKGDRVRALHPVPRRAPRVPPSHGRVRRIAGRCRPAHGKHGRRHGPALRQWPHVLRRWRPGGGARTAYRSHMPCALQGRASRRRPPGAQPSVDVPRIRAQWGIHRPR